MRTNYRIRPQNQGSAVSFVIVGLVLAGLLVGGMMIIKGHMDRVVNTPSQTTRQPAENKPTKQSTPEAKTTPTPQATVPSSSSQTSGSEIVATGPTETIFTTLILGIITAMIARYFQSRTKAVRQ